MIAWFFSLRKFICVYGIEKLFQYIFISLRIRLMGIIMVWFGWLISTLKCAISLRYAMRYRHHTPTLVKQPDMKNSDPWLPMFCLLRANECSDREQSESALPCYHVISKAIIYITTWNPFSWKSALDFVGPFPTVKHPVPFFFNSSRHSSLIRLVCRKSCW